jgi:hypothetical protein
MSFAPSTVALKYKVHEHCTLPFLDSLNIYDDSLVIPTLCWTQSTPRRVFNILDLGIRAVRVT